MIINNTKCLVGDNTGIRKGKCIRVLKQSSKVGTYGDLLKFSIKKTKKKKAYIKKKMYNALIINLKKKKKRTDGSYIKFAQNSIISLNDTLKPLGTRMLFPLSKEIVKSKKTFLKKIISSSKFII